MVFFLVALVTVIVLDPINVWFWNRFTPGDSNAGIGATSAGILLFTLMICGLSHHDWALLVMIVPGARFLYELFTSEGV